MKEVDGFFGQAELDSLRDGAHSQCEKQFEYHYLLIFFNEFQRLFDDKVKEEHRKNCLTAGSEDIHSKVNQHNACVCCTSMVRRSFEEDWRLQIKDNLFDKE